MGNIKFQVPLNNEWAKKPRELRVVCIGAGLAGVTLSYKIGHELKLEDVIDLQIYERQVSPVVHIGKHIVDAATGSYGWNLACQPLPRFDL
jgi:hypothetical protein